MKSPLQSYVFAGLLGTILVVSFSGCEKSQGVVDSQQSIADSGQSSIGASQEAFDLQLAAKVDDAITAEESLGDYDITVLVTNGVVRLTGEIETRAEHDQVVKVTRAVDGVDRINDQLRIKQ